MPRHPKLLLSLALLTAAPLTAAAQTPLELGRDYPAALQTGDTHSYTITLEEGFYVYGSANQLTCDVVVTIFNDAGEQIANFDGPARGPETFRFNTKSAGEYRIDVTPFEDETGDYRLTLRIAEPIATDPARRVDQVMAPYDEPGTPGGVVAVVEQGELTFARAYGSANLTHDIPFTVDTRTNIGSTTKQFTCYAILLLDQQGKLDIDEDVRTYIPELPDLGATVTLRHLMSHTSGYREFLNTIILTGRRLDRGDHIDPAEIIEIVQHQPELQNEPGAEWNYNNTAFGLLATTVERVTERPFPEWMDEHVFTPLGMDDTFVRGNSSTIIEHSAQGYTRNDQGDWILAADLGASAGAGGIYTTVGDLAKWVANFKSGQLGGHDIFAQMTTPFTLNSGEDTNYGFGLFIDSYKGLDRIQHGGADTAHRSMLAYFPALDAAVITQSNNASFDGSTANAVADAFFSDHFEQSTEEPETEVADSEGDSFDPASFNPESFDAFAGRYEMEEMPGFILEFTREGDKFYTQATGQPKVEIVPAGPATFRLLVVDAAVTFNQEPDGSVKTITLHQNGDHPGNRLEDEAQAPDLSRYTGRYFSKELETFYTVALTEGKLTIDQRRFPEPVTLTHNKDHNFTGSMPIAVAEFELDDQGNVTALIVSSGRTRGVRFEPTDL